MANEKRLIDAYEFYRKFIDLHTIPVGEQRYVATWRISDLIADAPTVDAVEVVHGRWIVDAVEVDHPFLEFESVWRDVHQCSICKEYFDVSDARNYCPNCGAKMGGGNEDG